MATESPLGIFLFISAWVVTALLAALFKKKIAGVFFPPLPISP